MSRVWVAQGLGCRIVFFKRSFCAGCRGSLIPGTFRLRVWGQCGVWGTGFRAE